MDVAVLLELRVVHIRYSFWKQMCCLTQLFGTGFQMMNWTW